ncbi:PASTA domain-containing protein [Geofilum sp. OHC36d9]|uniref:PASTA domain-containing protein n=1 Tax=Geofilum sp. OHC36d9 TaxID=3458413 RepID=UPI0040342803
MFHWKNLIDKTIWKHIAIITSSGFLLLIVIFIFLQIYTRHGQGNAVPDFTGLTETQFQHLVHSNHLRYTIIDSVHLSNTPKGIVVEQVPRAGEKVKQNRRMFFTINAWSEEKVTVPDVLDYSLREAKVLVESYGLVVGDLIYIPSEFTNLVLGQHVNGKPVSPGTLLPRGTSIDLLVGRGLSNETTAVPHLVGMKLPEARHTAQSVYLNIGSTIYDSTIVTGTDTLKAFIWQQNPPSHKGFVQRLGASIDVWLTTDSTLMEADEPEIPTELIPDNAMPNTPPSTSIEDELF